MEVHHHPNVEKKSFKEYILESLMIFIAVCMGFLAENIREHISDHHKEREYIKSFINDLKVDTAFLGQVVLNSQYKARGMDSLLKLTHEDINSNEKIASFYLLSLRHLTNVSFYKPDDATLTALKTAGNYRLIERDHSADSIIQYDNYNKTINDQEQVYRRVVNYLEEALFEMVDFTLTKDTSYFKSGMSTGKALPPLPTDLVQRRAFFNKVSFAKGVIGSVYIGKLNTQLEYAKALIEFLQKTYDLKDE